MSYTYRKITFETAKAVYTNRYTMEHVPEWIRKNPMCEGNGKFYAPGYASDRQWYDNTTFPGEGHIHPRCQYCESNNQTWPLGQWLDAPYQIKRGNV